jgi:hypothetical protein
MHSAKDVATKLHEGLHLSAFLPREDVRDVLILRSGYGLWALPPAPSSACPRSDARHLWRCIDQISKPFPPPDVRRFGDGSVCQREAAQCRLFIQQFLRGQVAKPEVLPPACLRLPAVPAEAVGENPPPVLGGCSFRGVDRHIPCQPLDEFGDARVAL